MPEKVLLGGIDLGLEMSLVNVFNPKKTRWWFQICLHNFYFGFVGKISHLTCAYCFRWLVQPPTGTGRKLLKNPCDGRFWLIVNNLEMPNLGGLARGVAPVTVVANEGLVGDLWGFPILKMY